MLLLSSRTIAQPIPPAYAAAQTCGILGVDGRSTVTALRAGPSGSYYLTGTFRGTVTFGNFTLTTAGVEDVFVAKLDAADNYVWVARAGGSNSEASNDLALDASGNVYVAGSFKSGTADFGSITLNQSIVGAFKTFVAKLNPTGNWVWAVQADGGFGGIYSYNDSAAGLALDNVGNIYVAGQFDSANLRLGALSVPNSDTTIPLNGSGQPDLYVAKLSPTGTWVWAVGGGGTDRDAAASIGLDANQNVYVAGYFESTSAKFGPTTLSSTGYSNVVVAKISDAGVWQRAVAGGSNQYTYPEKLAVAGDGTVYVTGQFTVSTTFGSTSLTAAGYYDVFVAKLSSAGTWLWASRGGGMDNDDGRDIVLDQAGNSYITGYFLSTTADFGSAQLVNSSVNHFDIFAAKIDSQGNWLWATQAGGNEDDVGRCLTLDKRGVVYLGGYYQSSLALFGGFGLLGSQATPYSSFGYIARLNNAVLSSQAAHAIASFELYPNPCQGAMWLTGLPAGQSVTFYTLTGQLIYTITVPTNPFSPILPAQALPAGMYIVRSGGLINKIIVK